MNPQTAALRYSTIPLLVLVIVLVAVAAATSRAATSSSIVSAEVRSALTLEVSGCRSGDAVDFGMVPAASAAVTSTDCVVAFGSSNDDAALRIRETDGGGAAMWRVTDGTPATAFGGGDGRIGVPSPSTMNASAIAVLDDGGFFAGSAGSANDPFLVTRHLPDGSLDVGWGTGGSVSDPGCASHNWVQDMVVQPDGKLVIALNRGGTTCIVRLDPDGDRDVTFNGGNAVQTTLIRNDAELSIDMQSTGHLIFGGDDAATTTGIAALRLTPSGAVDTSFGGAGTGLATVAVDPTSGEGFGAMVRDDDSIVVYGIGGPGDWIKTALLDEDGLLDTSWGGAGTGIAEIEQDTWLVVGAGIGPTGDAYLAGSWTTAATWDGSMVARFDGATGVPVAGYGSGGVAQTEEEWNDNVYAATLMPDGSVVTSGSTYNAPHGAHLQLMRFTPSGALDTSFGDDGRVHDTATAYPSTTAVALQRDGTIIAAIGADEIDGHSVGFVAFEGLPVTDYDAGVSDWDTTGTSHFGVCLRAVTDGATTDATTWSADTTDADCADGTSDPWRPVPDAAQQVALSPSGTADAVARLRFGLRTHLNQPPGRYLAPVSFEVVAP